MLSLFPDILFLAPFSIFLIRIALAMTLAYSAHGIISRMTPKAVRACLAYGNYSCNYRRVGAWTQAAALGASLIIGATLALPRLRNVALGTALLALVMAITLIVTGPGSLSFDLPL